MLPNLSRALMIACCTLGLVACASTKQRSAHDPFERFNRGVYHANDLLDRAIAKPAARAYVKITPQPIRTGVSNFVSNLHTPTTMLNDALQGKLKASANDLGRFVLNTTFGIGGILDPATRKGLDLNDEDFGQTLGKWGVPAGPYIVLPVLGPSSLRDAPSEGVDQFTNPRHYLNREARYAAIGLSLLDKRAQLLSLDDTLSKAFDPYAFVRDAYSSRREYQVTDGNVPAEEIVDPDAQAPDDAAKK